MRPSRHQLLAVVVDQRRDHLGVGARVERGRRGLGAVTGDAVVDQLGDGGVVALDEAVEAPLLLEDVGLGLMVRAAGAAVDRVERAHRGVRARVDRRLERRQVEIAQPPLRHVGRVVVAPALRRAVGGVVLDAGDDLVGLRVVAALGGLHACGRVDGVEVGILAAGLGDAAPARLVRDVDHRAVDLLETDRRGLARAELVVLRGDVRVERAGGAERDREDRAVAVDRVVGEQDRDVQRRGHRPVLVLVDLHRVDQAEDAADRLVGPRRVLVDLAVGDQLDLVQLVLQVHLLHELVDTTLDVAARRSARRLQRRLVARLRRCHDASRQCRAEHDHGQHESHPAPAPHASPPRFDSGALPRPSGIEPR